jgi:hypothetical protein
MTEYTMRVSVKGTAKKDPRLACPIEQGLMAMSGIEDAAAGPGEGGVHLLTSKGNVCQATLPPEAVKAMKTYDKTGIMKPFKFTISIKQSNFLTALIAKRNEEVSV